MRTVFSNSMLLAFSTEPCSSPQTLYCVLQILSCVFRAQAVVRACEPGDTLIFYFCGHGIWDFKTDRHFFANYDADGETNDNSFDMCELYAELNASFRGATVLLLADCCYSGMEMVVDQS
jgi:hypothetical protein